MDDLYRRFFICGADEIDDFRDRGITHLVSIVNPGMSDHCPAWFVQEYLQLSFGDVVSESDAQLYRTRAPDRTDISQALDLCRRAYEQRDSRILVTCDYGASRSPAMAYVFLADLMGAGREDEALEEVLRIRPDAVPNAMVVAIGDELLGRGGALMCALNELLREITASIEMLPIEITTRH